MKAIVFIFLQYFYTRPHFGRPFLKAFKGVKVILLVLKMFSFIDFNNLLEMKLKCKSQSLKTGDIIYY